MTWFNEALHIGVQDQGYTQRFEVTREVFRQKTEFQELLIFETPAFGRVLALDGVIQTTEGDEFSYHEMLVHVPLFAHGSARKILIIGGGDGGALREVLRHQTVEKATMVELDRTVIDLCLQYMPGLSNGAFDDPRSELIITDGVRFMAESEQSYDVIIIDSTDPIGPGEVLFTEEFYGNCKRRLTPGGILVTQNGVPVFQAGEVTQSWKRLRSHFDDTRFYLTVVPTYVGGYMALGWASDDASLSRLPRDVIAARFDAAGLSMRHYSPAGHIGAFALPPFIFQLMHE